MPPADAPLQSSASTSAARSPTSSPSTRLGQRHAREGADVPGRSRKGLARRASRALAGRRRSAARRGAARHDGGHQRADRARRSRARHCSAHAVSRHARACAALWREHPSGYDWERPVTLIPRPLRLEIDERARREGRDPAPAPLGPERGRRARLREDGVRVGRHLRSCSASFEPGTRAPRGRDRRSRSCPASNDLHLLPSCGRRSTSTSAPAPPRSTPWCAAPCSSYPTGSRRDARAPGGAASRCGWCRSDGPDDLRRQRARGRCASRCRARPPPSRGAARLGRRLRATPTSSRSTSAARRPTSSLILGGRAASRAAEGSSSGTSRWRAHAGRHRG